MGADLDPESGDVNPESLLDRLDALTRRTLYLEDSVRLFLSGTQRELEETMRIAEMKRGSRR